MARLIFHVNNSKSEDTERKIEETFDHYIDKVDDRTKAEFLKARVEQYKADLDADAKRASRGIELINCIGNLVINAGSKIAMIVIMGNCLTFETTGGFTSPISKGVINKIFNF